MLEATSGHLAPSLLHAASISIFSDRAGTQGHRSDLQGMDGKYSVPEQNLNSSSDCSTYFTETNNWQENSKINVLPINN